MKKYIVLRIFLNSRFSVFLLMLILMDFDYLFSQPELSYCYV